MSERPPPQVLDPLRQVVTAVVFGFLIAAAAVGSAYSGATVGYQEHGPPMATRLRIKQLATALEHFRADRQQYPVDLADYLAWEKSEAGKTAQAWSGIRDGEATDGWKHPLTYTRDGDACTIVSLGADGMTGGVGIDADLVWRLPTTADPLRDPELMHRSNLTFGQYLAMGRGRPQLWTAIFIGLLASLLSFALLRRGSRAFVGCALFTLLGTIVLTWIIGMLDIAKYH